jgi:hypothetical protein
VASSRSAGVVVPLAAVARRCGADGAVLESTGWCPTGGGYAVTYTTGAGVGALACPFACPICRGLLSWDGGCNGCRGSRTPEDRTSWTFPGDRYEAQGGHYRLTERGPRPCLATVDVGALLACVSSMRTAT